MVSGLEALRQAVTSRASVPACGVLAGGTGSPVALIWLSVSANINARQARIWHSKRVDQFLATHPSVHLHFTPTYPSWLNQVELRLAKIERDVIARAEFTCVITSDSIDTVR